MTVSFPIDLRSDTVTRPTPEMRAAMADAPVGDDQFGEDPSINLLQERTAALLGKEAALWIPTGTMSNQVALRTLTRPGDDVIVSRESHMVWHEAGGGAINAGIQFTEIGSGGLFTAADFRASLKPHGHMLYPPTTVVAIENTQNRAGGVIFPQEDVKAICAAAYQNGVASFLDGARLWNAAVGSGCTPEEIAAPFDMVTVAMSKGLGAPGGSVLAGTREVINRAIRQRRVLGGAMRQVGIFAAAALYALDHHYDRLADDHANARTIAQTVAQSPNVNLDVERVHTNIIVFHLTDEGPDANTVVTRAREAGVLVFAFGPRTVRAVTHLDVSADQCARAGEILAECTLG